MNHQHVVVKMKSLNRANKRTVRVTTVDAWLSYDVGHKRFVLLSRVDIESDLTVEQVPDYTKQNTRLLKTTLLAHASELPTRWVILEAEILLGHQFCQLENLTGVHREVLSNMKYRFEDVDIETLNLTFV